MQGAELNRAIQAWVADRDEAAARDILAALYPRVAAIVRRHWERAEDWDDLEQEVFSRVFAALPGFRLDGPPVEHWVSRIALNTCRSRWRSRSVRPEWRWSDLSEGEQRAYDEARGTETMLEEIESRDARSLLMKLLETLSADDRLVLSLLHLEERSVDEIAALTGLSRSAVKVRAFRARKRLRAALQQLE